MRQRIWYGSNEDFISLVDTDNRRLSWKDTIDVFVEKLQEAELVGFSPDIMMISRGGDSGDACVYLTGNKSTLHVQFEGKTRVYANASDKKTLRETRAAVYEILGKGN